jgi:hypothetical protein
MMINMTPVGPLSANDRFSPVDGLRDASDTASPERIQHLLDLLGEAVLLAVPAHSKASQKRWGDIGPAHMKDHRYLANLQRAGNIGVALGAVSNGLVTIDFDDDSHIGPFLEANPSLRDTLRTTAQRGCNIWLRCTTDYPLSCKLKDQSGNAIGEWRADGNYTIVAGTHPSGCEYRFVVKEPVITIDYNAIIWPDAILPPFATESKRVRGVRRTREKEVVGKGVWLSADRSFFQW